MDNIKVKSLYKALQILEGFSIEQPELGITEISKMYGLYKSYVYNVVSTFEKLGYLIKNPENNKYRLGLKILSLSYIVSNTISFKRVILPYMQEISNKTNECVYLGIADNDQVLYIASCYPSGITRLQNLEGQKAPMYCTGIGKAMLAFLPSEKIEAIVSKELKKFTEDTITDKDKMLSELEIIRLRGYAIDNMEHEYGIKCVGMPIRNKLSEVIAGISISGPSLRFGDSNIRKFADILKEYVTKIEAML